MKSNLLCLLLCSISLISQSQDSSFQLKDYKYRTPGYRALSVNLQLGGGISDNDYPDGKEEKIFQLGPVNANYYRFVSTDRRLHTSILGLYSSGGAYSSKANNKTSTGSGFGARFDWSFNNLFYKKDNWFLELGSGLQLFHEQSRREDTLPSSNRSAAFDVEEEDY